MMPAHVHGGASFVAAVAMWQVMMTAMMAPVVVPWVRAFAALAGRDGGSRMAASALFGSGYMVVWLGYSLVSAAAQVGVQRAAWFDHAGRLPAAAGGAVLLVAGLVQLTPLKQACLSHCRNPLTYFLRRWHDGPPDGFRLGLTHGAYCVGCCWALMATAFALGLMNLAWMAVLTALTAAEQLAPGGRRIGQVAGGAMMAWGIVRLLA